MERCSTSFCIYVNALTKRYCQMDRAPGRERVSLPWLQRVRRKAREDVEMAMEGQDAVKRFVERLYDQGAGREWEREERHRTEFAVTRRALSQHLPPPPARVLDCGGGPGRYAIELARQGYAVTLFDLSSACLQLAEKMRGKPM